MQSLTTRKRDSERCLNPICCQEIEVLANGKWRRTPRYFCSDTCRMNYWALSKVAGLLISLGEKRAWAILREMNHG